MNLVSFTNYRDKVYDLIDVFLWWKKKWSDIWETAVLKKMLRDDFTACVK